MPPSAAPRRPDRPYLLPAEQAAFLRKVSTWPRQHAAAGDSSGDGGGAVQSSGRVMELGYRASVRHISTADGTAQFYVPDELESFGHVNARPTEAAVLSIFKAATKLGAKCRSVNNGVATRATVLDIGSNEGFFGLLTASWGCRTWMFEPQPSCQAALYSALLLNAFGPDVARVIPSPVSYTPMEMLVSPSAPCVGQFPRHPRSYDERTNPLRLERRGDRRYVKAVNVSDILAFHDGGGAASRGGGGGSGGAGHGEGEEVLLAKVDVEGGELSVLESLLPLMQRRQILNLVVEITPGWWPGGERTHGCVLERSIVRNKKGYGCARSWLRAIRLGRAIDRAGYLIAPIPGHGLPAACDPNPKRRVLRSPYASPSHSAKGAPCSFSSFLARTMNETLHGIYQQDVWLRLPRAAGSGGAHEYNFRSYLGALPVPPPAARLSQHARFGMPASSKGAARSAGSPSVLADLVLSTFASASGGMLAGLLGRGAPRQEHYYVDLAANHPTYGSSTYELDKRGWSGLCIEPNPEYATLLVAQRTCRLARSPVDSVVRNVSFRFAGEMGGIEDERFDNRPSQHHQRHRSDTASPQASILQTQQLEAVLLAHSAPKRISYFSLDVEGAEPAVLPASFPWDSYIFLTLSIERPPPDLNARLFRHGYLFVRNIGTDTFYIHQSHPRASSFQSNASFAQQPAKCKDSNYKQYPDRVPLRGVPCTSVFGCCSWAGYPPGSVPYGSITTRSPRTRRGWGR